MADEKTPETSTGSLVTDLSRAVEQRNVEVVKKILLGNPQFLRFNISTYSILWKALRLEYDDVVELLIQLGADVTVEDDLYRMTPLHSLILNDPCLKNLKLANLLIKHGLHESDDNADNSDEDEEEDEEDKDEKIFKGPLRTAVDSASVPWVELLLQSGAEFKTSKFDFYSPVYPIFNDEDLPNRKEMLELFVKHGFDALNLRDDAGQNLLHLLVTWFLQHDHQFNEMRIIAEYLLNMGLDIDLVDNSEMTPLVSALHLGNEKYAVFLIEKGANVMGRYSDEGNTPLHYAAMSELSIVAALEALLKRGVDINVLNKLNQTPLHKTCTVDSDGTANIQFLIWNGADITLEDCNGRTAFAERAKRGFGLEDDIYMALVREIAKASYEGRPVSKVDQSITQSDQETQTHFNNCLKELRVLATTKFHPSFSYYQVLNMHGNLRKLAVLTEDPEFKEKFEAGLSKFRYYEDDLTTIYGDALKLQEKFLRLKCLLALVLRKYAISDKLLQKIVDYLPLDDLALAACKEHYL